MKNTNYRESGNALIYILVAIALLAALTAVFMEPSSQQTTAQNTFNVVSDVKGQADFIRSAIQECVLTYPGGDDTVDTSGGGTDPGAVFPYPIKPNSTHLTGPAGNRQVRNLRCPGNPGGDPDHADIFAGSSGKFMPPPVNFFEEWEYYNGTDGVFFYTRTDKSDSFLNTSLQKLDDLFSECQSDIVEASGANEDMTSTATEIECPDGSKCFRIWLLTNPTAVYNGDSDLDEAACP